jgi:hypothetical protein
MGELTTSSMKKGDPDINGSDLNNDNIIKPTFDSLTEEDRKALEAYRTEVDELFFSCYEVTRLGLVQKDTTPIIIRKADVTLEVRSNPSLSLDDVQSMINYALERQAKSSDQLICRLIEERDRKKLVDSNMNPSSSCTVNFVQINPQPSGTSAGSTSQPNPSVQPMNHFYSRTTIDGLAATGGMPQQTMTNIFRQGYTHATHSFSMPNLGLASYTLGCNGRTYTNTNDNYQAPYTTVAYTDPIPLPGSSAGFLPNYTYNNVMRYNTYDPPKFSFRSQPVEMTPAQANTELCVHPNNLTTQLTTILRDSFGI